MGRLSPVSRIDMSSFEGAYGQDPWCHAKPHPGARTCYCGIRKSKVDDHWGNVLSDFCEGCGKPNCPDCQYAIWSGDRA